MDTELERKHFKSYGLYNYELFSEIKNSHINCKYDKKMQTTPIELPWKEA
jgi:hypothetical protein